jgi:hypothetical protein
MVEMVELGETTGRACDVISGGVAECMVEMEELGGTTGRSCDITGGVAECMVRSILRHHTVSKQIRP